MTELEIFYDYVCPWCYFITGCIEQLQKEFDIDIRWTAFPLYPETPEKGLKLETLFADKNVDVSKMMTILNRIANRLGLPFGEPKNMYNSRLAQELGKWAESKGKGYEFHKALFRAYFVKEEHIGKTHVLVKLAESVNLNGKDAQKIIRDRTYREAIDSDWKRSYELSVAEVPTFLCNHQALVGAQPYETLRNFLLPNKVETRNLNPSVPRYDEGLLLAF
ncbi:MAG: DsbA family protein [Desulfobacterales bacterium]|jgi:predicted DsbA family dithiol-disulfide isomerase